MNVLCLRRCDTNRVLLSLRKLDVVVINRAIAAAVDRLAQLTQTPSHSIVRS